MSASPLLQAENLRVQYSGSETWIPQEATFRIDPGEVVLFVGPSGCGKSSLMLTFNGIIPHSLPSAYSGSIQLAGHEVADASSAHLASHAAMVMQDPDAQILTNRVWDEVTYALENLHLPLEEINERAAQSLRTLGIAHLASDNPWHLSGGQRQRVILAAALAMRPRLLILDEPTANLDPLAAHDFYHALPSIAGTGTAVAIVEHNLDPLIHHVTRMIAFGNDGNILANDTPQHVFSHFSDILLEHGIRLPSAVRFARQSLKGLTPSPLTIEEAASSFALSWRPRDAEVDTQPTQEASPQHHSGLEVQELTVTRGSQKVRRRILNRVSFSAAPGEIIAVAGVNGSGKSTLLRSLCGLQPWDAGTITVNAQQRHPRRPTPDITLVPQNPEHQFLEGSVRAELGRGLRIAGYTPQEITTIVDDLLTRFSLDAHSQANPFTLSGGQKRRLTVASALAEERSVICLDEPTFGQDQHHAIELMDAMKQASQRGTIIIVATHDLELISEYADKILLLSPDLPPVFLPVAQALRHITLLDEYGLMPTALTQITQRAREINPDCPSWATWKETITQ